MILMLPGRFRLAALPCCAHAVTVTRDLAGRILALASLPEDVERTSGVWIARRMDIIRHMRAPSGLPA